MGTKIKVKMELTDGEVFAVRVVDSNKKTVYKLRRSREDKDE